MIVQTGYTIWSEHEGTLADTQRDVQNFSLILAEYTSRYIAVADLVLQELRSEFRRIEVEPEATLQNRLASPDIRDVLVGKVRNIPGDNALVLFTPDGTLVNYSRPGPAPVVNIADRDFITHFQKHDDPGLYISLPVQSRVTGAWTLFLARRVIASDGQFLGVIVAAIDLRYLHDFYRATLTNSSQAVPLLRRDGVVVARFPDPTNSIGTSMPPTSPWYRVVANAGGTYRTGFLLQ